MSIYLTQIAIKKDNSKRPTFIKPTIFDRVNVLSRSWIQIMPKMKPNVCDEAKRYPAEEL